MNQAVTPFTLCDFLGDCAGDLQTGRLRPLHHYLQRYPGHDEEIAREYLALRDGHGSTNLKLPRIGRYELLGELARGGQGRVHMARDPQLHRFAAVKILEVHGTTDSTRRERFRREVAIAAQLDDPFLCRLFEADVDHVPPYAAMEFVPGHTLAAVIAATGTTPLSGPVAPATATERSAWLHFFVKVARALHRVHTTGIVHRDLKPANLMVTPDGEPRILDFGLAVSTEGISSLTMTETLLGTFPYMAPEQLQSDGHVDARTDVFALGVTMFECWTQNRPFTGTSPAVRLQAIRDGVPWAALRTLPADLRAVLMRTLAFSPGDRYATAAALADDLQNILERRPVHARPIGRWRAAICWSRRHPWLTTWLCTMAIALLVTTRQTLVADHALAATRQLERGVLDAVRTLDRWSGSGADNSTALATLRGADVDPTGGSLLMALLHLRQDDPAAALRELAARTEDSPQLRALRLACHLLLGDEPAARVCLPANDTEVTAVFDQVANLAGELYRRDAWAPLDRLLERSLELLAAPPLADFRHRWPLCAWELQAAASRHRYLACLQLWWRETALARQLDDSQFGIDFREAFLRLAADCVLDTMPRQVLHGLVQTTRAMTAGDDTRALRLEVLDLAMAAKTDDATIQRMTALVSQLATHFGEAHQDVVEARRRAARLVRDVKPELGCELLRAAWAGAKTWSDADLADDRRAVEQALVARNLGAFDGAALGTSAAADLRSKAARTMLARLGPTDERTFLALFDPPLDPIAIPEAADWFRLVLSQLPTDGTREKQRNDGLFELGRAARNRGDSALLEAYFLELQRPAHSSNVALLTGYSALTSGTAWHARVGLAEDWLRSHDTLAGKDLVAAMSAQAVTWERRLGPNGLGSRFAAEMLSALGWVCNERDWIEDATLVLETAALQTARNFGRQTDDPIDAAVSLPPWENASWVLVNSLAQVYRRQRDFPRAIRLWRHLADPPLSLPQLLRWKHPGGLAWHECGRALLASHDYAAAESVLQRCLRGYVEGRAPTADVASVRADLIVLYELMGRPDQVQEQRQALGR